MRPRFGCQPYRLPHTSDEFLRKEVESLLDLGIIVLSKSPWADPVILLPKKGGTKRLRVDYRMLDLDESDPCPIPLIDELIDGIGDAIFIIALDLTGLLVGALEKESCAKTVFVIPWGKYQCEIMPFGLLTALSMFHLLDHVLEDLCHPFAVAYLDNILIHS